MIIAPIFLLIFGLAVNETASGGSLGKAGRGRDGTPEHAALRHTLEQLQIEVNVDGPRHPSEAIVNHIKESEIKAHPLYEGQHPFSERNDAYRDLTPKQRLEREKRLASAEAQARKEALRPVSIEVLAMQYRWNPPLGFEVAAFPKQENLSPTDKAFVKEAVQKFSEELRKTPLEVVRDSTRTTELPKK